MSGVGLRGQRREQWNTDIPLLGYFSQLLRGIPKAFPGQLKYIKKRKKSDPVCPGSLSLSLCVSSQLYKGPTRETEIKPARVIISVHKFKRGACVFLIMSCFRLVKTRLILYLLNVDMARERVLFEKKESYLHFIILTELESKPLLSGLHTAA